MSTFIRHASLSALLLSSLSADTEWSLVGDGLWNEASNWTNGVPTNSGYTILSNGYTAWIRDNAVADGLRVGNGAPARFHLGKADDLSIVPTFDTRFTHLGFNYGHTGYADLFNGTWNNTLDILIGRGGSGIVRMYNDSEVNTGSAVLGYFIGAAGELQMYDHASFNVSSTAYGFIAGLNGRGTISLNNDATLSNQGIFILGDRENATGLLELNDNAQFTNASATSLAGGANSEVDVTLNGGLWNNGGDTNIGWGAGSTSKVTVNGGSWINEYAINLGRSAATELEISSGSVQTHNLLAGIADGGAGTINISGGNLTVENTFSIGRAGAGTGTMNMTGGSLNSHNSYLGTFHTSSGSAHLSQNALWTNENHLAVGYHTTGNSLTLEDDATLQSASLHIGSALGSSGSVTLSDSSRIDIEGGSSNGMAVGLYGSGELTVNGGIVDLSQAAVGREFNIGSQDGGLGVVTLNSGVINNTLGQSVVGSWGTGTLHINSGGHFSGHHMSVGSCETGDGTVNINGFGKLNVWSLTSHADSEAQLNITDGGTLRVSSPTQNLFENFGVGDTTVDGWGFIEIMGNDVSTATNFGGFSGDGHLFKTENGSLTLHGTNTLNGFYVQEGSLIVEGEVTGFVRVAAGAKVSGSGVTGEMTLSNAHLAPGSSPGEITVASLSFEGDNTIDFELGVDPSQSDLITVIGALTNDSGEILFNFINNGWVDGQTYDLINFGVSSISLADYDYRSDDSDLVGGVFSLNGNTLQFTPDIIPEPSSALLLVLAGFGLLRRQR